MPDKQLIVHDIPPVFAANSRVLLLGSLPSPKSRAQGFFYGHPQNRFWPTLAAVLNEPVPARDNIAAKKGHASQTPAGALGRSGQLSDCRRLRRFYQSATAKRYCQPVGANANSGRILYRRQSIQPVSETLSATNRSAGADAALNQPGQPPLEQRPATSRLSKDIS